MKEIIIDLFENEDNLKDLMDMVSLFVIQVRKKEDNFYLPTIDSNTFNFNLLFVICYNSMLFTTINYCLL
jgi:hypothetical protein